MINGNESVENFSENAEINHLLNSIVENNIPPTKCTHVSQEIANCDEITNLEMESSQINGVIGLGNSDEYLVKYPMKAIKPKLTNLEQKKNRKRNWRAVSKMESPGLFPKKFLKKHEKFRIIRRSSTRLQGQASPLYFPIFRLKSKDSTPSVNDLDTSGADLTTSISEKKKRGRPKRILSIEKPLETPNIVEDKPVECEVPVNVDIILKEKENDVKVKNVKIRRPKPYEEVTTQNNEEVTTQNIIPDSQQSADLATAAELKKKRPWNIPRNKLPSFTIVNNPLAFKTGEVYQSKALVGSKPVGNNVNVPLYACRICGKFFARKLSVRGHMKSHSKLFEYKIRTPQKSTLIIPSSENQADIEAIKTAAPLKELRKPKIQETAYVCDICGRIFYHKMGIRGHKKSHSLIVGTKRNELLLCNDKQPERSNGIALGHPLNTRSKAGIFDDIIFSKEDPKTEYPMWKKEVKVGEEFQATELPSPDLNSVDELQEDLIWSAKYTTPKVDQYLKLSDSPLVKYGGRNQEYALHILLRCQGNIWDALNILIDGKSVISEEDPIIAYNFTGLSYWTEDERQDFKTAWIKYGKDFTQIQKYVISKSLQQIVEFYYRWTIECPDEYRKYSRTIQSRKYLQTVTSPIAELENLTDLNDQDTQLTDEIFDYPTTSVVEKTKPEKPVVPLLKRNLPSPMGTPTRPAKSLKELVSSYQDRKEIKSQSSNYRSRSISPKKKALENTKGRKTERFHHQRVWTRKQLNRSNKANTAKSVTSQRRTAGLEGIPILKPVANSTHQRIINRMGTFPCQRCKRVFDRIKSLNAHMKCHRESLGLTKHLRESKTSFLKENTNTDC